VLATRVGVINHFDFTTWRVAVVGDAGVTQLDIEQWGDGSLVDAPDRRGCDLFATSWDDGYLDPLRPMGMYFVGRRLRYDRGELVPRGERIVRRRRDYFYELPDDAPATPAAWLRDAATTSRWIERPPAGDYRRGRITAVARVAGALELDVAFADGTTTHFDHRAETPDSELRALGWAATGGTLPFAYTPAEPARWLGTEVLVDAPPPCIADDDCEYLYDPGRTIWLAR
jgi:hypothetical protein